MSFIDRQGIGTILLASILAAPAGFLTACAPGSSSFHPESSATAIAVTTGYGREMEHEETYQGHEIVVTTREDAARSWSYAVVVLSDDGRKLPLVDFSEHRYASEEEARRAASSAAAAAIDRTRITRGKP